MLVIPRRLVEFLRAHAARSFPEECCGFLFGRTEGETRIVVEVAPTPNIAARERHRRYAYDPLHLARVEEELSHKGLVHIGFYHSHPTGVAAPSDFDRENAGWSGQSYVIAPVKDAKAGKVASWLFADDRSFIREELVEKP